MLRDCLKKLKVLHKSLFVYHKIHVLNLTFPCKWEKCKCGLGFFLFFVLAGFVPFPMPAGHHPFLLKPPPPNGVWETGDVNRLSAGTKSYWPGVHKHL